MIATLTALFPCENCGRITTGKSSKRACANLCAVKLNYAEKHNFKTPYQRYAGIEQSVMHNKDSLVNTDVKNFKNHSTVITNEIEIQDDSAEMLLAAQNRLKQLNKN